MIIGAHTIIYSQNPEADSAFLRDVLRLHCVEAGEGKLIFAVPPAEVDVHPGRENDQHEFFLMCDDITSFTAQMESLGITCDPVRDHGWGLLTYIGLPGGGTLGVYQPRHPRPTA